MIHIWQSNCGFAVGNSLLQVHCSPYYCHHVHTEVYLSPKPSLTWRSLGGILDLYVFIGPSPGAVVSQLTEVIGRPHLPPYWGLGFHLCRWGFGSANNTRAVVEEMRRLQIPQVSYVVCGMVTHTHSHTHTHTPTHTHPHTGRPVE